MGAEVVVTSDAWRDLAGIIDYIAKDDPAAADRFSDKLLDTALALGRMPHTGCKLKGFPGVRISVHGRYLVIYRIHREQNRVLVLRFWHSARDLRRLKLRE